MAHILTLRLPNDLHREFKRHAERAKVSPSEAGRTLLRYALGTVKAPYDAGHAEGKSAGYAEVMKRLSGEAPKRR